MPDLVTVVANATNPVALDDGRHLHPGEIAEGVERSERIDLLIDTRALNVVTPPKRIQPAKATATSEEDD